MDKKILLIIIAVVLVLILVIVLIFQKLNNNEESIDNIGNTIIMNTISDELEPSGAGDID